MSNDTPNPQTGSQDTGYLQTAGEPEPPVAPEHAWLLRLIGEAQDLDQRGQKLSKFIRGVSDHAPGAFEALPNRDKLLLQAQLRCMADLFAILNERIGRAQNPEMAREYDAKEVESMRASTAKAITDDFDKSNEAPQREVGDGA